MACTQRSVISMAVSRSKGHTMGSIVDRQVPLHVTDEHHDCMVAHDCAGGQLTDCCLGVDLGAAVSTCICLLLACANQAVCVRLTAALMVVTLDVSKPITWHCIAGHWTLVGLPLC
jgi:hypothetical protein